ncbi:glutathione peroxidase [Ochrovirga pacifica]|uniref:glutathione peroxidase n=1 Tax=Ochrovirga pacifica TaxID=1042376 RepID=UPI0002558AF8|nr:glutathione peroxidase [Ochrovirga pacifica]
MIYAILIVIFLLFVSLWIYKKNKTYPLSNTKTSLYDFVVKDLKGTPFKFADLKGKKVMIVNTASKCGLTPQYQQLQEIYENYKDTKNFIIIGFPSNNFLYQEPGDSEQIQEFCQLNYGVTFPMMEKVEVRGKEQAEIYQFLTHKQFNGVKSSKVQWNFQKYLFGRNGQLQKVIQPKIKPNDPAIISWIEND